MKTSLSKLWKTEDWLADVPPLGLDRQQKGPIGS